MGSAQASSLLTVAAAGHVDFPRVVITNPKSIEPHTSFELECNVSSQVQPVFVTWYQSNQAVDLMKQKYRTSWSNINESNLTEFYFVLSVLVKPWIGFSLWCFLKFISMIQHAFTKNLKSSVISIKVTN